MGVYTILALMRPDLVYPAFGFRLRAFTALREAYMSNALADQASPADAAIHRKQLYWHSRRGMWELDLLLIPFLDTQYEQLTPGLQADYARLLREEDQDLFAWMMRREPVADASLQAIVDRIVEHAAQGSLDQYRGL